MISRGDRHYANIKTMSELRAERARLSWQIEMSEQSIENQVNGIGQMFSFTYLSAMVMRKIDNLRTWVSTMYDGYRLVTSLFSKPADECRTPEEEAEPQNQKEQQEQQNQKEPQNPE